MNSRANLRQGCRVGGLLAVGLVALLFAGCDDHPLKDGVANWKPQSTGGPIETRPLPPAQEVHSNYERWLESETVAKVRLYELVLSDAVNQSNYLVKVQRGDTPLGATDTTFVTFNYQDSTNGTY